MALTYAVNILNSNQPTAGAVEGMGFLHTIIPFFQTPY
jgi:hypothetical protein